MKRLRARLQQINSNTIIAVAAVVISLCALLVSFQEVRIMRQQQKASMYPYLELSRSYNHEGFEVYIRNSGPGLARINSMELTNGDRYFSNWIEVIEAYLPDSLHFGYEKLRTNTINEVIITPNERVRIFFVYWSPATRMLEERTRDLEMKICYSSLLEDYWLLAGGERPKAISAPCERIEERQFY